METIIILSLANRSINAVKYMEEFPFYTKSVEAKDIFRDFMNYFQDVMSKYFRESGLSHDVPFVTDRVYAVNINHYTSDSNIRASMSLFYEGLLKQFFNFTQKTGKKMTLIYSLETYGIVMLEFVVVDDEEYDRWCKNFLTRTIDEERPNEYYF